MPAEIHDGHDSDRILLNTKEDAVGKMPKHCSSDIAMHYCKGEGGINNSVKRLHNLPDVTIFKPGALFPVRSRPCRAYPAGHQQTELCEGAHSLEFIAKKLFTKNRPIFRGHGIDLIGSETAIELFLVLFGQGQFRIRWTDGFPHVEHELDLFGPGEFPDVLQ